ncbi:hypothetical protein HYU91_02530 [Candidatus Collierbacteria bacterium]|nr:hypothetical protein [Candidatus Collierbacteria bacterium]
MIDLRQILQDKRNLLDRQLAEAKFTRDHAATPTESHSDKTRQNAEQLMDTLNDAKKKLQSLETGLNKLPPFSNTATANTLITLRTPLGVKNFLLVPDGFGGQTIGDTFLLSVSSTLAQSFLNKKAGYTFSFNGGVYQIIFLNPNK